MVGAGGRRGGPGARGRGDHQRSRSPVDSCDVPSLDSSTDAQPRVMDNFLDRGIANTNSEGTQVQLVSGSDRRLPLSGDGAEWVQVYFCPGDGPEKGCGWVRFARLQNFLPDRAPQLGGPLSSIAPMMRCGDIPTTAAVDDAAAAPRRADAPKDDDDDDDGPPVAADSPAEIRRAAMPEAAGENKIKAAAGAS